MGRSTTWAWVLLRCLFVRTLHETPVLSKALIEQTIEDHDANLSGSDLAEAAESVKFTPTRLNLEELSKLVRVIGRDLEGAPHECLLVLDSNTGQNAISQTRLFSEVVNLTGLVLTKLDGTAKGGVIVGLADAFGIPMKFVGVGEAIEDLRDFSAEEFVEAVFDG